METTQTQHTPGPWEISNGFISEDTRVVEIVSDLQRVALVTGKTNIDRVANAQLIASAPELLQALKAFVESNSFHDDLFINARAAIAKAEGK